MPVAACRGSSSSLNVASPGTLPLTPGNTTLLRPRRLHHSPGAGGAYLSNWRRRLSAADYSHRCAQGRNFYCLAAGKVIVTVDDGSGGITEKYLGPGDTFGELALLHGVKRSASVRVAPGDANATAWVLERSVFRRILSEAAFERRKLYTSLLGGVKPLSSLSSYSRSLLADALTLCEWKPGDIILTQGVAEGARFHIIVTGSVRVSVGGVPVKMLTNGAYFGEVALLAANALGNADAAPSATVTVEGAHTKTVALGRSAFRRLLGEAALAALSENVRSYIFQANRPGYSIFDEGGPAEVLADGRSRSRSPTKSPGRVSVSSLSSDIAALKVVATKQPPLIFRPNVCCCNPPLIRLLTPHS